MTFNVSTGFAGDPAKLRNGVVFELDPGPPAETITLGPMFGARWTDALAQELATYGRNVRTLDASEVLQATHIAMAKVVVIAWAELEHTVDGVASALGAYDIRTGFEVIHGNKDFADFIREKATDRSNYL